MWFEDNRYTRCYFRLINKAKNRLDTVGLIVERHHIIPRCIAPALAKNKDNIVPLTVKEHFICHLLLTKMMMNKKHTLQMKKAFGCMALIGSNKTAFKAHQYEKMRLAYIEGRKSYGGTFNGRKHSPETIEKIKAARALQTNTKKGKPGHKWSSETRAKIMALGAKSPKPKRVVSEETKKKISQSKKGSIPWNKGAR